MTNTSTSTSSPKVLKLENSLMSIAIAPELGGKILSVFNKPLNKEFLWHNEGLRLNQNQPGDEYDVNFWGGIDELLPNDIPETVDGIDYPDHGELWTTPLDYKIEAGSITLCGILPKSGLFYKKTVSLVGDESKIQISYRIHNTTAQTRHFLWKLHAALYIAAGDQLITPAKKGRIVYPESARFRDQGEFSWPVIEGADTSVIPEINNKMDFFYLYDTPAGEMSLISKNGQHRFSYYYDQAIFPYQWYFASYGQFRGHYTAILEPASAMPVSVNEAASLGQCSVLAPNEEINTTLIIYAGENSNDAVSAGEDTNR